MTMTPTDNLDEESHLQWCVCGLCLVAWVIVCPLRRSCSMTVVSYRFLVGFPLIKRSTLFFLINEDGKSFASFQKNHTVTYWFRETSFDEASKACADLLEFTTN
jgi:hypothetical protein